MDSRALPSALPSSARRDCKAAKTDRQDWGPCPNPHFSRISSIKLNHLPGWETSHDWELRSNTEEQTRAS